MSLDESSGTVVGMNPTPETAEPATENTAGEHYLRAVELLDGLNLDRSAMQEHRIAAAQVCALLELASAIRSLDC